MLHSGHLCVACAFQQTSLSCGIPCQRTRVVLIGVWNYLCLLICMIYQCVWCVFFAPAQRQVETPHLTWADKVLKTHRILGKLDDHCFPDYLNVKNHLVLVDSLFTCLVGWRLCSIDFLCLIVSACWLGCIFMCEWLCLVVCDLTGLLTGLCWRLFFFPAN